MLMCGVSWRMTDAEKSIERLTEWIAECGHNKRREFTADLVNVLAIARVAVTPERDKMTDEQFEAISRMTAWLRDYGDAKPKPFVDDVRILLEMAKESLEMAKQQKTLEDVLLSDAFMTKFAEAFTKASVVTSKNQIDAAITALWETPFNVDLNPDRFPVAEVRSERNADGVVEDTP